MNYLKEKENEVSPFFRKDLVLPRPKHTKELEPYSPSESDLEAIGEAVDTIHSLASSISQWSTKKDGTEKQ